MKLCHSQLTFWKRQNWVFFLPPANIGHCHQVTRDLSKVPPYASVPHVSQQIRALPWKWFSIYLKAFWKLCRLLCQTDGPWRYSELLAWRSWGHSVTGNYSMAGSTLPSFTICSRVAHGASWYQPSTSPPATAWTVDTSYIPATASVNLLQPTLQTCVITPLSLLSPYYLQSWKLSNPLPKACTVDIFLLQGQPVLGRAIMAMRDNVLAGQRKHWLVKWCNVPDGCLPVAKCWWLGGTMGAKRQGWQDSPWLAA